MDVERQREVIRLWNRMRQVEGPLAEELRIQILQCFAKPHAPDARMSERPTGSDHVPARTAQVFRIGERDGNARL